MYTIDSHQHFWKYNTTMESWISEKMSILKQDYLPNDLTIVYKQNGIDGCIAVQAAESLEENDFLLRLSNENEFIKGVVGWLDFFQNDIETYLESYSVISKMKGFRSILQGSRPLDIMLNPLFIKNIGKIAKHDFTYDLLIYENQLQYAFDFVKKLPHQKIVLDHIGKPNIKEKSIDSWKKMIFKLAQFPNLYCKVSGMTTEGDWDGWKNSDFFPYLDFLVECFGIDRLMYGSDWPVCLLTGNFTQVKNIVDVFFNSFSEEEKAKFYSQNAMNFYGIL